MIYSVIGVQGLNSPEVVPHVPGQAQANELGIVREAFVKYCRFSKSITTLTQRLMAIS